MPIDTNAKWAKWVVWTTMVVTLVATQSIFTRTGFHSHWSLPIWAILSPHSALFALSYTYGPLLDTRRPHLRPLKPFPRTISIPLSYALFILLPTDWVPHRHVATSHWSMVFLGLLSVYLLCLSRVICPGVKVYLPYIPLVLAAKISCHASVGMLNLLWVPFAILVISVEIFLEESDKEISENALAAERDYAAMIRLIPARRIMNL